MITSDNADKHEPIGNKPIGNKITKPLKFSGFVAFRSSGVNSQAFTFFISYSFPISSTSCLSLNSLTTVSAIIHQKNVPLLKFSHIKKDGGCRETVLHLSFSQMAYAF